MTALTLSPFLKAANDYHQGGDMALTDVTAAFQRLDGEEKKLRFGQLCQRRLQANDRLIDLLFAIGTLLPCQRPTTLRFLAERWQTRGKDPHLAAQMLTMIIEQFAA